MIHVPFIYGRHKAYNHKRISKQMVNWPCVADPDTTSSPTVWVGHAGEHQEQLGEHLLLEFSLVLKW